ncbi:two-component sensor histidine kinase [Micromonospora endophytica]|uniref:sensor histidine kinase n=1 Tax=Micromonospora endophytica TaxID=515350 RepID=UPI001BB41AAA|nr:histidine kinase [Micromonospora endophytica]BCJ59606.1 two-component sensor histidine kinase [Micromonospora endophytica]
MTFEPRRRRAREIAADVCCVSAALVIAVALAGEAEDIGQVTGRALFWALVPGVIGSTMLWWRRRYPVRVALALAPLVMLTDMVVGSLLIIMFTLAEYRRWGVTAAFMATYLVAHIPYLLVRPDPHQSALAISTFHAFLLMMAAMLGTVVRARRDAAAAVRDRALRAKAQAELRTEQIRAVERVRIAREMHDVLAHRISLVSLHAGALEIRADLPAADVSKLAGTIRVTAHQALDDLREILGVLRGGGLTVDGGPVGLRPQPDLGDLDTLVAECREAGAKIAVTDERPDRAMSASMSRTAYRVVQEGLTNARKHAAGIEVHLHLTRTPRTSCTWSCATGWPTEPRSFPAPVPVWSDSPSGWASPAADRTTASDRIRREGCRSVWRCGCRGRRDSGADRGRRPAGAGRTVVGAQRQR